MEQTIADIVKNLPQCKQEHLADRPIMPAFEKPLEGEALIKEVCRRIRVARSYWDAHNNAACRKECERALALYNTLSKSEKEKIPQVLRVWLRYRSEKYFGAHRTPPSSDRKSGKKKGKRGKRSQWVKGAQHS